MRAAQIETYGGPKVITITQDAAKPTPRAEQVLVEVRAASINPFDAKLLTGAYQQMMPITFPFTPGGDVAGIVRELGEDLTEFAVGDNVYGAASSFSGGSGALAEFATAKAQNLAPKPTTIDFTEAAAAPLTGVSAIQALEEHIKLQKGHKILIHGGAGGIGTIAIQLAKHLGAYVATTVRKEDTDYVKELGADEVIDYQNQKFEELLKDYDAVFDTVGGDTYTRSFPILKSGGVIVSMLEASNQELMEKYGVTAIQQSTKVNRERLIRLAKLIDIGAIKIHVDKTFPLEKTAEAFTYFAEHHPRGKVVLTIR